MAAPIHAPAMVAVLAAALLACGCTDDPGGDPGIGGTGGGGGTGGSPPDTGCPAGELFTADGSCLPVGIPESACGDGFVPDGAMGCEPILPSSPCAPGEIAVPGDETCRPITPCGTGTWGDIPVEPTTQYVDGSYTGGVSNGTSAQPWTTIAAGVNAAAEGDIVAIAAGTYAEDVIVFDDGVKLWGRCPELTSIVGSDSALAAVSLYGDGTALHAVAVTGGAAGVLAWQASPVTIDRSWIHDTGGRGVALNAGNEGVDATVSDSLIEGATQFGLGTNDVTVRISRSNIRGTQLDDSSQYGVGVFVDGLSGDRAAVEVEGSLIEDNTSRGLWLRHGDARVSTTVVRRTRPTPAGGRGWAMALEAPDGNTAPTTLTLDTSVLEDNVETALVLWVTDATVTHTVIRNTQSGATGRYGFGISLEADLLTPARSTLHLSESTLYGHHEVGLFVGGATATVTRTRIGDIAANSDGDFGDGITAGSHRDGIDRARVELQQVWIGQNDRAGTTSFGAVTALESCTQFCNPLDLNGESEYFAFSIPFEFDDRGGNHCGCDGTSHDCQVLSAGLQAPSSPME